MFNLYVEALQQLPSCLIFKHVDDDALFLSDALAQHLMIEKTKFDARTQCPIQFYDLHSGVGLSGDHCPIAIAQSGGELCQHIVINVFENQTGWELLKGLYI